jgi:hypothetical protein
VDYLNSPAASRDKVRPPAAPLAAAPRVFCSLPGYPFDRCISRVL